MVSWSTFIDGLGVSGGGGAAPETASDARLLERGAAGDEAACRALIERHAEPLHRIVERTHADLNLSEDVVQEAFVRALRHQAQLREDQSFFPWLVRIALRVAIDFRRKHKRERLVAEAPDRTDDSAVSNPELLSQNRQLEREVRRALIDLKPSVRELIVLRYYSHFSVAELAAVFNKSEPAIRKDLQRARAQLKRRLGRWFEAER